MEGLSDTPHHCEESNHSRAVRRSEVLRIRLAWDTGHVRYAWRGLGEAAFGPKRMSKKTMSIAIGEEASAKSFAPKKVGMASTLMLAEANSKGKTDGIGIGIGIGRTVRLESWQSSPLTSSPDQRQCHGTNAHTRRYGSSVMNSTHWGGEAPIVDMRAAAASPPGKATPRLHARVVTRDRPSEALYRFTVGQPYPFPARESTFFFESANREL